MVKILLFKANFQATNLTVAHNEVNPKNSTSQVPMSKCADSGQNCAICVHKCAKG